MKNKIGVIHGEYDYSEIDLFWEYTFYKSFDADCELMVIVCDGDNLKALSVQVLNCDIYHQINFDFNGEWV